MKYVLLVCRDASIELSPEERGTIGPEVEAWVSEMKGRGILRPGGGELRPLEDARTVRVRHGEIAIADGPFAETKEQIAGLDILECAEPGEAIEAARTHPVARLGAIELRPFMEA